MKCIAIIPAAGKGKRSGTATPKQFVKFNKKELIVYTLEVFERNKNVNEIIIATDKNHFKTVDRIKKKYGFKKLRSVVEGGKERQDSVYNALISLDADKNDLVAVHDAARPLLSSGILTDAIETAAKKGNAVVALKARDTLLKKSTQKTEFIKRDEVYYIQTPQIFRYKDLVSAMEKAYKDKFIGTDESSLFVRLKKKINLVDGSMLNFKVTTKDDMEIFKRLA